MTQTPLSAREAAFVRHYLAGRSGVLGNGTQAAIAAGYASRSAAVQAHALLRKPKIQEALAARYARADITVDRVLEELRRVAFSDMRAFAEWGPDGLTLKASADLADEAAPAVAEVIEHRRTRKVRSGGGKDSQTAQVVEERHVRIKLHDKLQALTTIAKHLGVLRDRPDEPERPLFPRGFFAAAITGDVDKIKGFLPEDPILETTPTPEAPGEVEPRL
jgi:phage terminase small subunit